MVNLTVNGQPVAVPEGTVLLEAVRTAGVDLPTLCYHKTLAPYGACRLCMVAITSPRKAIVASCAYPVEEGLVVETHAPEAIAVRRLTLEFLLSRCLSSRRGFLRLRTCGAYALNAGKIGQPVSG